MASFDFKRDVWEPLRAHVANDDGLPVYECGHWTVDKLYFLGLYLSLVTRTMKTKRFVSVNYVDLFCGPGVDVIRDQKVDPRYPGSPMLAAAAPNGFDQILLADQNADNVRAAIARIRALAPESMVLTWNDDANAVIGHIAKSIPERSLTVAFVDPYALNIKMSTISIIAARGAVDLVVLFADRMDVGRNLDAYYAPGKSAKLDEFFGERSAWKMPYETLDSHEPDHVREFLSDVYQSQLRKLGYQHFRTKVIRSDRGPLYRLVYASKHEMGLKFWDIASRYSRDGSPDLF